jgi:hypothetical protein
MPDLDLFGEAIDAPPVDDYHETTDPAPPACYTCEHLRRPLPPWPSLCRCRFLGRQVEPDMGTCSNHKEWA